MAAKKRRKSRKGLRGSTASCKGTKGKGRLRKGYKWKRGHACPVKIKSK